MQIKNKNTTYITFLDTCIFPCVIGWDKVIPFCLSWWYIDLPDLLCLEILNVKSFDVQILSTLLFQSFVQSWLKDTVATIFFNYCLVLALTLNIFLLLFLFASHSLQHLALACVFLPLICRKLMIKLVEVKYLNLNFI